MFAGDFVGDLQHLLVVIHQNHLAVIAPGDSSQVSRGQVFKLAPDLGFNAFRE